MKNHGNKVSKELKMIADHSKEEFDPVAVMIHNNIEGSNDLEISFSASSIEEGEEKSKKIIDAIEKYIKRKNIRTTLSSKDRQLELDHTLSFNDDDYYEYEVTVRELF